jgi:Flp pilus assembly pilin Flp
MTGGMTAVYARVRRRWRWLVRDTAGASLVEYVLLLALIAIVAGAGVKHLGWAAKQSLNRIGLVMPASEGGS